MAVLCYGVLLYPVYMLNIMLSKFIWCKKKNRTHIHFLCTTLCMWIFCSCILLLKKKVDLSLMQLSNWPLDVRNSPPFLYAGQIKLWPESPEIIFPLAQMIIYEPPIPFNNSIHSSHVWNAFMLIYQGK